MFRDTDAAPPGTGDPPDATAPYRDPTRSPEERAQDLLGRMTLDEKLAQLGSLWSFEVFDGRGLDPERARARLAGGIGQITRVAGATNLQPEQVAAFASQIQRFLLEEMRLGVPAIIHEASLHGVMARGAVCFPQSIGQAATWEPALVEEVARLIGGRLRARRSTRHTPTPMTPSSNARTTRATCFQRSPASHSCGARVWSSWEPEPGGSRA
jgi:hypothetical protein